MRVAIAGLPGKHKSYIAALAGVGLEAAVTTDPAHAGSFSGLLLPGGGDIDPALYGEENHGSTDIDRPLDEAQLAMTDAFVRAGRPILGICKGMQIINVYFGGGIIQHLSAAEAHRAEGRDAVHPCLSPAGSFPAELYGARYPVNSLHHQGVGRLGRGLQVAARSEDGVAEALAHETLPILAVQWHPERMCFDRARPDTVDGAALFRRFRALME